MSVRMRSYLAITIAAAACAPWSGALGEEAPLAGVVKEVRIQGNSRLSDAAVRMHVRTRASQAYNPRVIREDRRRLLDSGRFKSVIASVTETPGGAIVTFTVVERPVVAGITFSGNKAYKDARLRKELMFAVGDPLDLSGVEAGRKAIALKYRKGGYFFVRVEIDRDALERRNLVAYTIVEGPSVRIRRIKFEGNRFFGNTSLKLAISSSIKPWWWLFDKGKLDMDRVAADVAKIREKYLNEAFLDVEVSRVIEFSDDKSDAYLTFQIRENGRARVNKLIFNGNVVLSDSELAGRLLQRPGDLAKAPAMSVDTSRITDAYGALGYIEAKVRARRQFLAPDAPLPQWADKLGAKGSTLVNMVFDITEADQYRVRRVEIHPRSAYDYGEPVTQDRILRRAVTLFPGQLFSVSALKESQRRLRETRLFSDVSIKPVGKADGAADALVEAVETETASLMVSVSASTNTGIFGTIALQQRNFDAMAYPRSWRDVRQHRSWQGAGQTLRLRATPGTESSSIDVSWTDPAVMDLPYSLSLGGYISRTYREGYDENRGGVFASAGHRFRNGWYAELASSTESIELVDISARAADQVRMLRGWTFLQKLSISLTRDRTDSRWRPTTGDRLSLEWSNTVGDFDFQEADIDYRIYQTVHVDEMDRKHVLAAKAVVGQIINYAPTFQRFYGGGLGSIRGFRYRGIGPRAGLDNDPIGGDFQVFAGAEYRYPIVQENLHGVLFLDTGAVEQDMEISKYRVSAGFGFRLTPSGWPVPFRFDFGFPITKAPEDERLTFNFSLGWWF
ncbi:MAG: outer membrane protein assembly factor BamA [Planctomycetes bacterium]|nr:outer membrane protein assembly factor BamA [Planctomycetota bacterium]